VVQEDQQILLQEVVILIVRPVHHQGVILTLVEEPEQSLIQTHVVIQDQRAKAMTFITHVHVLLLLVTILRRVQILVILRHVLQEAVAHTAHHLLTVRRLTVLLQEVSLIMTALHEALILLQAEVQSLTAHLQELIVLQAQVIAHQQEAIVLHLVEAAVAEVVIHHPEDRDKF